MMMMTDDGRSNDDASQRLVSLSLKLMHHGNWLLPITALDIRLFLPETQPSVISIAFRSPDGIRCSHHNFHVRNAT